MYDLTSVLFQTKAFKVCRKEPFWYTSGKIGPYFVNTHYLYGDQQSAEDFLDYIDSELKTANKLDIPIDLFEKANHQYEKNYIYRMVVDSIKDYLLNHVDMDSVDYISGGERRDWYFSIILANMLGKPHITIFKDLSTIVTTSDFAESTEVTKLTNARVLHIADLLNQGSSYERAWIPAIRNLGATLYWSFVVVDRLQGGKELLKNYDIVSLSLVNIDEKMFKKALDIGIINQAQYDMLLEYEKDPDTTMHRYIIEHPNFIRESLNSDDMKIAKRAKLCLDNHFYGL